MSDRMSLLAGDIAEWMRLAVGSAGAEGLVLGLSGGVDSAAVLALSAMAVGPRRVMAVHMPCGSSPGDASDASLAAEAFGVGMTTVRLDGVFGEMISACGLSGASRLTLANIRPRLRMTVLYAFSTGRLVVGTGNLSEILVGYSTKWGDSAADIAPLAGLYKDEVVELARVLGVPGRILGKAPSAGLWEGQTDEGEMGVTYDEIRSFFEAPGSLAAEAAGRIAAMHGRSRHKREPIPSFDARGWLAAHGE